MLSNTGLLEPSLQAALIARSEHVLAALRQTNNKVVTAESCTGGLVAALLTHHAGSSDVTEGGLITYSNALKNAVLGVRPQTLNSYGAVSAETVQEMAEGALRTALNATVSVAISGIAGPSGGTAQKPVGLVWFATARRGQPAVTSSKIFTGDRLSVRTSAAQYALDLIMQTIS